MMMAYTMFYAASKYNNGQYINELEEAIIGTEGDDYDLHNFNDYLEGADNHVFVFNGGRDHVYFDNDGYQVAFMGDGSDEVYMQTSYDYGGFVYADLEMRLKSVKAEVLWLGIRLSLIMTGMMEPVITWKKYPKQSMW